MLLVDDGQAQPVEFDMVLDQRLRADHQPLPSATAAAASRRALAVRLPVIQAMFTPSGCNHAASLRKCCSARISVGAISATWAPAAMAWSRGDGRDHGLAAAHVALQQAMHRIRLRQVRGDFRTTLLRASQRTAGPCSRATSPSGASLGGRRGFLTPRGPGGGQRQLLRQQLVDLMRRHAG